MHSLNSRGFVEAPKRNNLIIFEDAGGYVMTQKAINNCHLCYRGNLTFDQLKGFTDHCKDKHPDMGLLDIHAHKEFARFHVELGNGHLEENCRRNFLGDDIFYQNFVKAMIKSCGFTDQQAGYQVASHDNHK